jgi:hypothetical protein
VLFHFRQPNGSFEEFRTEILLEAQSARVYDARPWLEGILDDAECRRRTASWLSEGAPDDIASTGGGTTATSGSASGVGSGKTEGEYYQAATSAGDLLHSWPAKPTKADKDRLDELAALAAVVPTGHCVSWRIRGVNYDRDWDWIRLGDGILPQLRRLPRP